MSARSPLAPLISRRTLLLGAAALAMAPRAGAATGLAPEAKLDWLATAGIEDGFALVGLDGSFATTTKANTPARLHGVEMSPDGRLAVAIARRPGKTALAVDRARGDAVTTFAPGEGRVFSGHGRFSEGGRLFLTNEIERVVPSGAGHTMGRGVIAVRDVAGGFAIRDEWPSGGDGPHDLMRAGDLLVVANGGIEPHTPEARDAEATGSTITLLDPATGAPCAGSVLPADLASLSLRHLAAHPQGGTVVAAQDLLNDGEARPLLFAIGRDGALTAFSAPDGQWRMLRGYVGSVAFDPSGAFVAASSPRGGQVTVFRSDGRHLGAVPLADGCALAPGPEAGSFVAASGYGEVILITASTDGVGVAARRAGGPRFDNHMMRVG